MKSILLIAWMQSGFLLSSGQDAKDILKQSFEKCQSVQNGYYQMNKLKKPMNGGDTLKTSIYCHFKKLSNDSIYPSAFHYKYFTDGVYSGEVLYTGDDFVRAIAADSTATIMSKWVWSKEIKSYSHNYIFFSPFTSKTSSPLQHDSDFIDNKHIFKFIGVENFNGVPCNHIRVNEIPENVSREMMKALRKEYHYWISREDSVPLKYSIAIDFELNNDIMHQFEMYSLKKYEINKLSDEAILTIHSIPSFYLLKDFVPYKNPDPLQTGTPAPDWELPSLTYERIGLKNFRGQLVLINFIYKSCYPCMQALPFLQTLSEKYRDRGLRVIGIDPFDRAEDEIGAVLTNRGVNYTVLIGGNRVARDYRVSGYPAMYLIDRTGRIIFVQTGYGKDAGYKLEELIRNNL